MASHITQRINCGPRVRGVLTTSRLLSNPDLIQNLHKGLEGPPVVKSDIPPPHHGGHLFVSLITPISSHRHKTCE